MNDKKGNIDISVSVENTDYEISEAVIVVEGHEIRIPYTELLDKGKKLIRNSFINIGYMISYKDIMAIYDSVIDKFYSIKYMYSRVTVTPDVIALNHEYNAQGITDRQYNGSQLEQSGSYSSQQEMFIRLLNNNVGSAVLAATLSGISNRVLGIEDSQQIINVVGKSSTGKTTLCKGLGSVFGNRDYMVADNTELGLEKLLGNNQALPIYADDFLVKYMTDKKKRATEAIGSMIMSLSKGMTKTTAVRDGKEFSGSFIMTSENSITDMLVSENNGIIGDMYRFIEIPMDEKLFQSVGDVNAYSKLMKENKGFLGDMFAEYLMQNKDEVRHKYDELYERIVSQLNQAQTEPNVSASRCANRITSLVISYYIAANVNGVYSDNRIGEFINFLIAAEINQLSKYKKRSIDDKFRMSLIEDYAKLDKVLGEEYKPVEFKGDKKVVSDKYSDYDENGSLVIVRMSRETFKKYVETKGFDEKIVIDMLRANRNSEFAKIAALPEGRSYRIDKRCSDLNRRMVVIKMALN